MYIYVKFQVSTASSRSLRKKIDCMNFIRRGAKSLGSTLLVAILCCASIDATAQTRIEEPQTTNGELKLTLKDALRIAFTKGETVKIDSLEIEKVKHDKKTVSAKLFPKIDASGDYSYTIKKQVMYLGGGGKKSDMPSMPGMPDMSKGIEVGRTNNISGGVSLGMPLIAPQLWTSLKLSKQQLEAALIDSQISHVNLTNNVTKAFYGLQLALETVDVMQQSLDNAQMNFDDISKKYNAGMVALYDKIRAEVQVKNLEPNLLQAENAANEARRMLNILLGIEIDAHTTPLGIDFSRLQEEVHSDLYQELLRENKAESIYLELKKIDKQIEMLKSQEQMAKNAFLPTLSLGGFMRISAMDDGFNLSDYQWTPYSAVQLTLSIPLFSGGERKANMKKARIATNQVKLQRELQKKNLDVQSLSLKERLETTEKKVMSAKEAVNMASKGYEIAKKRYDTGASTLVELNDADLALLQAKLNLKQATYEFYVVKADIDKLRGKTFVVDTDAFQED